MKAQKPSRQDHRKNVNDIIRDYAEWSQYSQQQLDTVGQNGDTERHCDAGPGQFWAIGLVQPGKKRQHYFKGHSTPAIGMRSCAGRFQSYPDRIFRWANGRCLLVEPGRATMYPRPGLF